MAIQKIPNTLIADNAVTAAKIANGSLTADDIANNSITAAKISASTSPTFGGLTVNGNVTINTDANSTFTIADGGTDAITLYGGSGDELYIGANAAYKLRFKTDGNIVMDNGGSFGIGTSSPLEKLDVRDYTGIAINSNYCHVGSTVSGAMAIFGHNIKSNSGNNIIKSANTGYHSSMIKMYYNEGITFHATSGTATAGDTFYDISGTTNELMRITNSGNLLVGTTSTGSAAGGSGTSGININANGGVELARSANPVLFVNRTTSDGDIAQFRKDGSTVGSIGNISSRIYIGSGDTGIYFDSIRNQIQPNNPSTGSNIDATIDLGRDIFRFKDLYLSGGAYLGGTGAANHLDDYEEGNWTPVFNNFTATGTTSNTGLYVKVGRLVYVELNLNLSSPSYTGGGSGTYITGLPFSPSGQLVVSVGASTLFNTATYLDNNGGGSNLFFKTNRNTISGIGSVSFMNSSGYLRFSATYYSTA